jgi:hypothetical protein
MVQYISVKINVEMLLFCRTILDRHITLFITQDYLLFGRETPTFSPWAVLGEGCSSARDPVGIRALLIARDTPQNFSLQYLTENFCLVSVSAAPFSVDDPGAGCDFPSR